jgi:aminoglycoside 6'-N-acetyltransferase I
MNIELKLSTDQDAHIIKNLWPLYQHDVSEFDASKPNRHGLFGVDDSVLTLAEHSALLDGWWQDPQSLFPYLILVDGSPAGFNLVAARSRLPASIEADFVVHEFFVLHAYRGQGIGEKAAVDGFAMHPGAWEIVTYPNHARAIAFWRRVINGYSNTGYAENEMDHPWGRRVVFRFGNRESS